MVCGEQLFLGETEEETKKNIKFNKKVEFPLSIKYNLSPEIKDLIKQLLIRKPSNRISIEEIYQHPWITGKWRNQK
jgi:serine/threonine protein kinase